MIKTDLKFVFLPDRSVHPQQCTYTVFPLINPHGVTIISFNFLAGFYGKKSKIISGGPLSFLGFRPGIIYVEGINDVGFIRGNTVYTAFPLLTPTNSTLLIFFLILKIVHDFSNLKIVPLGYY